jgi:hypothetical protein
MSGWNNPSFRPFQGVRETLPCLPKVPPSGFAYPLDGVSSSHPWKPLSAPNALGLSPSELSSSSVPEKKSPSLLPPSRFPTNPSGLVPAPRRFLHTEKAVPLSPPDLYSGSEAPALLGFRPLRLSLHLTSTKRFSLPVRPLVSSAPRNLTITEPRDPRASLSSGLALSLRKGRRPLWPSSPTAPATRSKCEHVMAYFFGSESLDPLRNPPLSSLPPTPPLLSAGSAPFRVPHAADTRPGFTTRGFPVLPVTA